MLGPNPQNDSLAQLKLDSDQVNRSTASNKQKLTLNTSLYQGESLRPLSSPTADYLPTAMDCLVLY